LVRRPADAHHEGGELAGLGVGEFMHFSLPTLLTVTDSVVQLPT
jgi:hypothetical protein